jgi:hypothetical protein
VARPAIGDVVAHDAVDHDQHLGLADVGDAAEDVVSGKLAGGLTGGKVKTGDVGQQVFESAITAPLDDLTGDDGDVGRGFEDGLASAGRSDHLHVHQSAQIQLEECVEIILGVQKGLVVGRSAAAEPSMQMMWENDEAYVSPKRIAISPKMNSPCALMFHYRFSACSAQPLVPVFRDEGIVVEVRISSVDPVDFRRLSRR